MVPSSYIHASHNAELLINTLSAEWGMSMAGLNAQSILLSPPSFFYSLSVSLDWVSLNLKLRSSACFCKPQRRVDTGIDGSFHGYQVISSVVLHFWTFMLAYTTYPARMLTHKTFIFLNTLLRLRFLFVFVLLLISYSILDKYLNLFHTAVEFLILIGQMVNFFFLKWYL